ncbi:hypothetical protein VDGD_08108 [Verticillium dahliae]|nr:hypothetical protein VdG1_06326 [Verticillium dahliae VDG1]RBQ77529.1 hypothetical protein VDGD_08108 [Verticillium dahliae]
MLKKLLVGLLVVHTWAFSVQHPALSPGHAKDTVENSDSTKINRSVDDPTTLSFRISNGSSIIITVPALATTEDGDHFTVEKANEAITHCGGSVYDSVHTSTDSPLVSDCKALLEYFDAEDRRWFLDPAEDYPKLFTLASTGTCAVKALVYDKTYIGNGDGAAILRRAFDLGSSVVDGRIEARGNKYCDECFQDCDGFRTQTPAQWQVEDPQKPDPNAEEESEVEDWGIKGKNGNDTAPDNSARSIVSDKAKLLGTREDHTNWMEHVLKTDDGKEVTFQVNAAVMRSEMVPGDGGAESNDRVTYVTTEKSSIRCHPITAQKQTKDLLALTDDCRELVSVLAHSAWHGYWLFSHDDVQWCHKGFGTAIIQLGTCVFSACPVARIGMGNEDVKRFIQSGIDKVAGGENMRVTGEGGCELENKRDWKFETEWMVFAKASPVQV